jgi:hypothetical protein
MASERPQHFVLEIDGGTHELGVAEFTGILFEIVTTLVFEKLADRATYVLATSESELTGSGGIHFDPLCVSLYRHLKENRYHGPSYPDFEGDVQSFHLHSIKDGLVAVAFFLKSGESVPHFIVGHPGQDVLIALDRGARTRLSLDDPRLLSNFEQLLAG